MTESLFAIDPGDKRIGVATFELYSGKEINRFTLNRGQATAMIAVASPTVWVVEDYTLDHARNKGGSKLLTSKVIGWIELRAYQTGAALYMQSPSNLRLWALHEGIRLGSGHIPDDTSAFLHGSHYLIQSGFRKPKAPLVE